MAENVSRDQKSFLIAAFVMVAVMAVLAGLWVFSMLNRSEQAAPAAAKHPPLYGAVLPTAAAGFPGGMQWAGLVKLADALPSARGWEIRYNAAATLARRGNTRLALFVPVLCEMLDENQQMRNFTVPTADGRHVPNESEARMTVLTALKAVHAWHKNSEAVSSVGRARPELQRLYQAINDLTHSPNRVVSAEATKVRLALGI